MTSSEVPSPAHERQTTQLPVVVLGDGGQSQTPILRLLPGRVEIGRVMLPLYALAALAGVLAFDAAVETREWSATVVAVAWGTLYTWFWIYGVAYRHRRPVLGFFAWTMALGLGTGLTLLSWERAQAQLVAQEGQLLWREPLLQLQAAALCTLASCGLLMLHLVFLGRGYRNKRA